MVRWAGVPPVTWIWPRRAFQAARAALATVSKFFEPCSAFAFAAALATLTYDSPTRTLTVRLWLASKVTNAPDPGPDTETLGVAAGGRAVDNGRSFCGEAGTVAGTAPLRTEAEPWLTASLCQVPIDANGLSKVAEKYTRYTLPPPQKCPLVAQPLMVLRPTSTCASVTPLTEPETLTSNVAWLVIGYVIRPIPERGVVVSSIVGPESSVTP